MRIGTPVVFGAKGSPLPLETRQRMARELIRQFDIQPKDRHVLLNPDDNHQGIRNRAYESLADKYGISGQALRNLKQVLQAF